MGELFGGLQVEKLLLAVGLVLAWTGCCAALICWASGSVRRSQVPLVLAVVPDVPFIWPQAWSLEQIYRQLIRVADERDEAMKRLDAAERRLAGCSCAATHPGAEGRT